MHYGMDSEGTVRGRERRAPVSPGAYTLVGSTAAVDERQRPRRWIGWRLNAVRVKRGDGVDPHTSATTRLLAVAPPNGTMIKCTRNAYAKTAGPACGGRARQVGGY